MISQGQPIATAPIGGEDFFPPETPRHEPLNFVLLWQPLRCGRLGAWRLGYWGGAAQPYWYDDAMGLMEPQPTYWMVLPPMPLSFAGDVDAVAHAIHVAGKVRHLAPAEFRLFEVLYRADLLDGEWRSAAWLCEQLGIGRKSAPALRRQIGALEQQLAGSRFAVESNGAHCYRLAVSPLDPQSK